MNQPAPIAYTALDRQAAKIQELRDELRTAQATLAAKEKFVEDFLFTLLKQCQMAEEGVDLSTHYATLSVDMVHDCLHRAHRYAYGRDYATYRNKETS